MHVIALTRACKACMKTLLYPNGIQTAGYPGNGTKKHTLRKILLLGDVHDMQVRQRNRGKTKAQMDNKD